MLTEQQKQIIEVIGTLQMLLKNNGKFIPNEVYYWYEGCKIVNTTVDESERYVVDPKLYYGEDFLKSDFIKLVS